LAQYPPDAIEKKLGKFGLELIALARGEDHRPVEPREEAKSISQEQTFTPDLQDREEIAKVLLDQAEQVGWELRKQELKGYTVHLKVRYPDFTLITRSQTLLLPTDLGIEIYRTALKLLGKTEVMSRKARLLGVGVSNLRHRGEPVQKGLFDAYREKEERSLEAVDKIWSKYGPKAIKRASLVASKEKRSSGGSKKGLCSKSK
jgi:nucleotidyltransferase/DNA polymerase involved in DNA repair